MENEYYGHDFSRSYEEKNEHLIDTLDFNKLVEIKKKQLKTLLTLTWNSWAFIK